MKSRFGPVGLLVSGLMLGACTDSPTAVRERPVLSATSTDAPVLVGAGDIASCISGGDEITAAILDGIPGTVFTTGDNAYEDGTAAEFQNCYEPSWGRHRARTRPSPGNHDYHTPGAAGYFAYFDSLAGPSGRGYYSYDLGFWHLISLDSHIQAGASSAQYQWLKADLEAHPTACTLAYWHHPLFTSGIHGNIQKMKAIWKVLDGAGVDVVVNGHDHDYERFAPQNAEGVAKSDGVREFIVGTGGESLRSFGVIQPNSEVRYSASVGVLKLTLHPASYSWEFVADPITTFTDTGSAPCVETIPPVASGGGPYTGEEGDGGIAFDGTGSSDPEGQALTYSWDFGDGETGEGAAPTHTYADDGDYVAMLVVTDPGGDADTASTTVTVVNAAPVATFTAPGFVPFGTEYTLSLTDTSDVSSADQVAGFTYAFDCGTGYGEWGTASTATCSGVSVAGARTVNGKIRDKDLGVSEYTATVEVEAANQPPVASGGGPYSGAEGSEIAFNGSSSADPENEALTFAWDFGDATTGSGATPTHAYADNGGYTVTLVVTDPEGAADTASGTVTVTNVKPTATFNAPAEVPRRIGYVLSLTSPSDVSSADLAAGFTYAFKCKAQYSAWGPASSVSCSGVKLAGTITVGGKIRDKNDGTTTFTRTILIK